jgi:hypothetical protein
VKVSFVLDARQIVKGKLLGPDGRLVSGAFPAGLRHDWFWGPDERLKTDEFTALGVDRARPRLLGFVHPDRQLAGSVVVRGHEKAPITVRLAPWGTVSGRLLDGEGRPIQDVMLWFTDVPVTKPGEPRDIHAGIYIVDRSAYKPSPHPRTDAKGRFRVEGLIPGLKYHLALSESDTQAGQAKWKGLVFTNLVLTPGQTRDLGDVKLQPFPKE